MNDERRYTHEEIVERLVSLLQEIPVSGNLWSSIERAIEDEPLDARLSRLDTGTEPADDLWPAIAARIRSDGLPAASHSHNRWRTSTVLAACLCAAAIGTFRFLERQPPDVDNATRPDTQQVIAGGNADVALDALFSESENPESAQAGSVYLDHIAMVRSERQLIEESMRQYPNDTALRTLWRHAYETELQLIDEAQRVLTNI